MTRLPKEDYRNAVGILKRYNYNCLNISDRRADIMDLSVPENTGMPKAPYSTSDPVYNQNVRLEEDKELQKSATECNVVRKALKLVSDDSKYIFQELYVKSKTKWDIIESGMSERTFVRRKSELIYAVDKEIKKLA